MSQAHRFPFEKHHLLDSPGRRTSQPTGPLVDLVARTGPEIVLDIGAGTGYFTLALAEALPNASLVAIDVEAAMLHVLGRRAADRRVTSRVHRVRAAVGVQPLPLLDGIVDVTVLVNLYHEIDGRQAALAELRRVTQDAGRIVICDWNPAGDASSGPPSSHRVEMSEAAADLRRAGFSSVAPQTLYADHWVLAGSASDGPAGIR